MLHKRSRRPFIFIMRAVLRGTRRFFTPSTDQKYIKVLVERQQIRRSAMFYLPRSKSMAKFQLMVQDEFGLSQLPKAYECLANGEMKEFRDSESDSMTIEDAISLKIVELKSEYVNFRIQSDFFQSDSKKVLMNSIIQKTLQDQPITTPEDFTTFLQTKFAALFSNELKQKMVEFENLKHATESIIEKEKLMIKEIKEKGYKKSKQKVSLLIAGSTVQFSTLFYLTFFVYDWNVIEPVAYLTSLGIQIVVLAMLAFRGRQVNSDALFQSNIAITEQLINRRSLFINYLRNRSRILSTMIHRYKR